VTIAIILGAAAAAVALWPSQTKKVGGVGVRDLSLDVAPVVAARHPRYIEAVANLAAVKARLSATELLHDDQAEAINTLTLALVAGSDQE
jgi:uncharacterized membrane protein YeiH